MNRRQFLTGVAACALATALPLPEPDAIWADTEPDAIWANIQALYSSLVRQGATGPYTLILSAKAAHVLV